MNSLTLLTLIGSSAIKATFNFRIVFEAPKSVATTIVKFPTTTFKTTLGHVEHHVLTIIKLLLPA